VWPAMRKRIFGVLFGIGCLIVAKLVTQYGPSMYLKMRDYDVEAVNQREDNLGAEKIDNSYEGNRGKNILNTENIKCDTIVRLSGDLICMPSVFGWRESIASNWVKDKLNSVKGDENLNMAIYIDEKTDEIKNKSVETSFTNYFKVYVPISSIGKKLNSDEFEIIAEKINGNQEGISWNDAINKISNKNGGLKIGVPVLLRNEKRVIEPAYTSTYLIATPNGNDFEKNVMILNLCNLNGNIIMVGYYLIFVNDETIELAQSRNDYFISKLYSSNSK
jgi:hypothetical protein